MSDVGGIGMLMARSGSKRLPGKNIRLFAGKPMFMWAMEALLRHGGFSRVIVSTDSREIARLAEAAGAEVPFIRPEKLANDNASTFMVMKHAMEFLRDRGDEFASICCTYGTSAFLTDAYLNSARELLKDAEVVFAATRFEHPIQRGFLIENGEAVFPNRAAMRERTQDLPSYYHDVGMLYWVKSQVLMDDSPNPHFSDYRVRPLVLSRGEVVDIDDEDDWIAAERLFAKKRATC